MEDDLSTPYCVGTKFKKNRHITPGQNIFTGNKLCWDAILRQGTICILSPDAIFRPEEICSMDDNEVTVQLFLGSKNPAIEETRLEGKSTVETLKKNL